MDANTYRTGLVLTTLSAIAWSLGGLFTRLIPLDTATLLTWRGLFGAIGILIVIIALRGRAGLAEFARLGKAGWLLALLSTGGMISFIASLRLTTVAHNAVIYATLPFIAAAIGWIVLRERPARSAILTSLIALIGVGIMVGASTEGGLAGDLLAVVMTITVALMMVVARRNPGLPVMPAACVSALLSGLICWPFGTPFAVTGQDLAWLAVFGFVNSALGFALFTLGARLLPPMETALIGALDTPLAPLWVWLAFGETPSPATLLGGTIVLVTVTCHIVLTARRTRVVRPA